MKVKITFKPNREDIIPALDQDLKDLNREFQKEGIFTKLYKAIPNMIRGKLPFDMILENKDKLTLIDGHRIEKSAKDDGTYIFFIDFTEATIEAFDIIKQAIDMMPPRLKQQLERVLCQDGSRLENITRDGIKRKVIKGLKDYGQVISLEDVV